MSEVYLRTGGFSFYLVSPYSFSSNYKVCHRNNSCLTLRIKQLNHWDCPALVYASPILDVRGFSTTSKLAHAHSPDASLELGATGPEQIAGLPH